MNCSVIQQGGMVATRGFDAAGPVTDVKAHLMRPW